MKYLISFLILFLITGCQMTKTPSIEMDVDLGSFGIKHITSPVTIERIDNNTVNLSYAIEAHFSFHAGYKVTFISNESFTGTVTSVDSGNTQFSATKEIEYLILTVDSVNAKSSTSTKRFVTVTGDMNTEKFKITYNKQP